MDTPLLNIAVIEDDPPMSAQLRGWIESARPDARVDQWFTRDDAEAAILKQRYDLVVMDIELGRERHAGVALIMTIVFSHPWLRKALSMAGRHCSAMTIPIPCKTMGGRERCL